MLAIVIPYYKLTFFKETLDSLANQTDKRFKVYIGDDASLEDCSSLLEKYKDKFNFKYKRFDNNLGSISLVKHWERCIELIGKEEWIMILGDDDMLGKNVVEELYKNLNLFVGISNVIRFATKIISEELREVSKVYTHPTWENAADSYYRRHKGFTRSSLSEFVFSKETYLRFRFHNYPLAWHSDDFAWLEFSGNKLIYSINESIIYIRISINSITGKLDNERLKDLATIQFMNELITLKLFLFKKNQSLELMLAYETIIKRNRKLKINEWLLLLPLYLKYFKLIPLMKYIRRFLISIIK